jgi:hypothetical protein
MANRISITIQRVTGKEIDTVEYTSLTQALTYLLQFFNENKSAFYIGEAVGMRGKHVTRHLDGGDMIMLKVNW